MTVLAFSVYIERGCSPDVHQQTVVAAIAGKDIEAETRSSVLLPKTFIPSHRLAAKQWHYAHCHGEYRGVLEACILPYVPEDFFTIILVNASTILKMFRDIKQIRKTASGLQSC